MVEGRVHRLMMEEVVEGRMHHLMMEGEEMLLELSLDKQTSVLIKLDY